MSFDKFSYIFLSLFLTVVCAFWGIQYLFVQSSPLINPVIATSQSADIKNMSSDIIPIEQSAVLSVEKVASATPALVQAIDATNTAKTVIEKTIAEDATVQAKVIETPKISDPPKKTISRHSTAEIDYYFKKYVEQYNVSESTLRKIAVCESGYNELSKNGDYGGLFQFSSSTWKTIREEEGENSDPALRFDAEQAIKTAAFKISHDGVGAWVNCSK